MAPSTRGAHAARSWRHGWTIWAYVPPCANIKYGSTVHTGNLTATPMRFRSVSMLDPMPDSEGEPALA
jgi:hypothetical protein